MNSIQPILLFPDKRLRQKAAVIEDFGTPTQKLAQTLLDTMHDAQGIGLAANQIGVLQKIVVIDCAKGDEKSEPHILINPEVAHHSQQKVEAEEGCLSFPAQYAKIKRSARVDIKFQNLDGKWHQAGFEGIEARCAQHEIDHLNGILFIDHCSLIKRKLILQKMHKLKKSDS